MNELDQKTWEAVNAYHDGELSDTDRRELESRFQSEPLLEEALKSVGSVSTSLSRLRPATQETTSQNTFAPANRNWQPARWLAGGAVAAGIALAVVLVPQSLSGPAVFDIHAELAAQSYTVEIRDVRPALAGNSVNAPDLLSANLTVVAMRQVEYGTVAHYAGRNGCRLSYFRGAFPLDDQKPQEGRQVAAWSTVDDTRHMIVATGMDQAKFDAIAAFLNLVTKRQAGPQIIATLVDTTANAERCVS